MPTLNWIGKQAVVKHHKEVPFRLLEPVAELSCPSPPTPLPGGERVADRPGEGNVTENLIVQGDNLDALKALLPRYAGQVKCIYIDPPYNTGNEGWVYNDNVNSAEIKRWLGEVVGKEGETLDRHDRWLCMMYPRLLLLKQFLREDGSIWISIDDAAITLLRCLMDEIFGTDKFVACNVWQKRYSRENREAIGDVHEYVLVYAMSPANFKKTRHKIPIDEKQAKIYRNPNSDPKGRWRSVPMTAQAGHATSEQFYEITTPSGKKFRPSQGRCWGLAQKTFEQLRSEGRIYFGKNGSSQPNVIRYLSEVEGVVPWTWWPHDEVGNTDESTKELMGIFGGETRFNTTPKPSRLIQRILQIATDKDSLILDSFAGSGTTGHAVLKQNAEDGGNRRFILVEMDENIAQNVTAERVRRVSEGYSKGALSPNQPPRELSPASVGGEKLVEGLGGGFQFCTLSKQPLFTAEGQIRDDVTFAQLAEFVWFIETGTGLNLSHSFDRHSRAGGNPDNQTTAPQGGAQNPTAPLINSLDSRLRGNDGFGLSPLLGIHQGRAIYLLYNGILKDKSVAGGNVLSGAVLDILPAYEGAKVIYAAACRLGTARLHRENIVFKQTPYALAV
ncbi:MAG: site-specific DNA-methyltransferase [Gallionella sp.]|nr:site-specific DNA-methyltransferase [Gallionella sp.]